MPKNIPKYVQVLNRVPDPDNKLKEHLIKAYELDGVLVDKEMARLNPNAKTKVICVTSRHAKKVVMAGAEEFEGRNQKLGHWIYCGNLYYVRKLGEEYEFAQYLRYNTETKKTEGLWDAESDNP